ncbi:hypothetical protein HN011_010103, partial [Eciton burchellii]
VNLRRSLRITPSSAEGTVAIPQTISVETDDYSIDEWTHGEAEEIYRQYQQQDDQYTGILADTLGGPYE